MTRIDTQIDELQRAPAEVLAVFADGPLVVADMLKALGHDVNNFMLTEIIGDNAGEWQQSAHQKALSDLIDQDEIRWWKDDKLEVWYGLRRERDHGECGDNSPAILRMTRYLDAVCNMVGEPRYTKDGEDSGSNATILWAAPFDSVREIDDTEASTTIALNCTGKTVEVRDYDFVVGAGSDEVIEEFDWPREDIDDVVVAIKAALSAQKEER